MTTAHGTARAGGRRAGSHPVVVVGSRGRGAFRGMVLGSVSQQLLHRSPCAVAVIHEMNEASS